MQPSGLPLNPPRLCLLTEPPLQEVSPLTFFAASVDAPSSSLYTNRKLPPSLASIPLAMAQRVNYAGKPKLLSRFFRDAFFQPQCGGIASATKTTGSLKNPHRLFQRLCGLTSGSYFVPACGRAQARRNSQHFRAENSMVMWELIKTACSLTLCLRRKPSYVKFISGNIEIQLISRHGLLQRSTPAFLRQEL